MHRLTKIREMPNRSTHIRALGITAFPLPRRLDGIIRPGAVRCRRNVSANLLAGPTESNEVTGFSGEISNDSYSLHNVLPTV